MTPSQAERNPIDVLAEEFAERYRRGERPALSEYIRQHPELEEEIREVFPALVMMEQFKPAASDGGLTPCSRSLPECIGDYRLLREIGRGGMGIVYEAEQVSLGRHVALKVFSTTGLTSPTYLERFRREARAAARLHHTNIVPVFGVGESGGVHYYAMQFIHGEGMDKVLADLRRLRPQLGKLPVASGGEDGPEPGSVAYSLLSGQFVSPVAANEPVSASGTPYIPGHGVSAAAATTSASDESVKADPTPVALSGSKCAGEYYRSIARIGLQIAEALAYAHKQAILHRDIKPSNLILDLQGTVWITDFGLAKADDADDLTHTGDLVGTMRYMPPERFEGSSVPQGDIYAVGITLYEMVTLQPAFDDANHARLIQRIEQGAPLRPRQLVPDIPRDLETIVLKAGARDPADRYATAEALAEDLQRFLGDRPIRARRHAVAERLWRWGRRNPVVATLTGVIAAILIAVAIGSSFAAFSLSASKRDALEQLWRAKLSEARATTGSRQQGQRFTSLKRIREALAIARKLGITEQDRLELRNAAIAALALPDFDVQKEWAGWPAGSNGLDYDAALERYARSDREGNVSIRRVSDDRELVALPGLGQPATIRLSPSGRYLVVCGGTVTQHAPLKLWDLDARPPRCIHRGTSFVAAFADFSPDDAHLAYASLTELMVVEVSTGKERPCGRLPGTAGASGSGGLKWSPQGNWLAVGRRVNGKTRIEVRDVVTRAGVASMAHDGECWSFAWHPDGRLLAVGAGRTIHLWDVAAQTRRAVLEGHRNSGIALGFSRAGDRLVSSDWSGTLRLWDVATGRQLLSVLGMGMPTFGTDGSSAACVKGDGSGKLQVLRFASGREVRTLAGRVTTGILHFHGDVCQSGDGQLVALQTSDLHSERLDGMAVLDRRSGRNLGGLSATSQRVFGFAQDGSLWTFDGAGNTLRWPRQRESPGGPIRFGPPEPVVSVPGTEARAVSADGRTLLLGNYNQGGLILHRGTREQLIPTGPQNDVRYGALSPDGRWAATGSHWCWNGIGAKVWDARTGRLEKEFSTNGSQSIQFSPDSRWFSYGHQIWRAGTWEEGPRLGVPGDYAELGVAFAPQSRLLAVPGQGRVRLVRPDTGAEVARLAFGEPTSLAVPGFTPDGAELLVRGEDTQDIHIWDLRLIRAQLAELGLDWDDPPLPPDPPRPAVPSAVEFFGADLIGNAQKLRQYRLNLALLALSVNPFDAQAHFRLAQLSDDPRAAIAYYTASLAFDPRQPLAYENRALAAFKLQRWSEVAADMDQVLKDHSDQPVALNYRAIAHQKLGQHAQAIVDLTALLPVYPRDSRLYDLRAQSYEALADKPRAAADRRKAEELAPDDPVRLNARAWTLLTGPPAQRDADAALKLACRAVDLTPNEAVYVNTLGVAQYRNGRYREALATLQRSLALGNGQFDAFDLFFLAMCHHKLGELKEARHCNDRAVDWVNAHKNLPPQFVDELRAFQSEAQAELGSSPLQSQRK